MKRALLPLLFSLTLVGAAEASDPPTAQMEPSSPQDGSVSPQTSSGQGLLTSFHSRMNTAPIFPRSRYYGQWVLVTDLVGIGLLVYGAANLDDTSLRPASVLGALGGATVLFAPAVAHADQGSNGKVAGSFFLRVLLGGGGFFAGAASGGEGSAAGAGAAGGLLVAALIDHAFLMHTNKPRNEKKVPLRGYIRPNLAFTAQGGTIGASGAF